MGRSDTFCRIRHSSALNRKYLWVQNLLEIGMEAHRVRALVVKPTSS